jgi:hypothetical protein
VQSAPILVIKSNGFSHRISGSRVLQTRSQRFLGRETAKIKFRSGRTAAKCPGRLGGLEIAGSRVDDTQDGILSVFFAGSFRSVGGRVSVRRFLEEGFSVGYE